MTDKTMVADTLVGINGDLAHFGQMIPPDRKCSVKTDFKTDEKPERNVTGRDLSDRKSKKLLRSCSKSNTGRSFSCKERTDTVICSVTVQRN